MTQKIEVTQEQIELAKSLGFRYVPKYDEFVKKTGKLSTYVGYRDRAFAQSMGLDETWKAWKFGFWNIHSSHPVKDYLECGEMFAAEKSGLENALKEGNEHHAFYVENPPKVKRQRRRRMYSIYD